MAASLNSSLTNLEWMNLIHISRRSSRYQTLFHYFSSVDEVYRKLEFWSHIKDDETNEVYYCLRLTLAPDWFWYEWMTTSEINRRTNLSIMFERYTRSMEGTQNSCDVICLD